MLSITFFPYVTLVKLELSSIYHFLAVFQAYRISWKWKPARSRFFFTSSILRTITSRFATIGFVPRSVSKNRHNLIRLLCPVRNFWVYDTSAFHRQSGKPNFSTSSNKSCFTSTTFEITGNALRIEKMIRRRELD